MNPEIDLITENMQEAKKELAEQTKLKLALLENYPASKIPCDRNNQKWHDQCGSLPLCCDPCPDPKSIFYHHEKFCCTYNSNELLCPDLYYQSWTKFLCYIMGFTFLFAIYLTCKAARKFYFIKKDMMEKHRRQNIARAFWMRKLGNGNGENLGQQVMGSLHGARSDVTSSNKEGGGGGHISHNQLTEVSEKN